MRDIYTLIRTRYRYPAVLLRAMVTTDLQLRYQASALGYFWTLLRPLAMFTILYVVFARFLRIGAGIPYYAIYLLFGIVAWGLVTEMTTQGLTSIVVRAPILRKVNFPRYVVILSVAMSVLISFVLNLFVVVIFMVALQVPVHWHVFWILPLFLELIAFALSVSFFLSALYVRFRDLNYIWEVFLQAAFYATPVLYPLQLVPARFARILVLNPVAQIIQDVRDVLVTDQTQTISKLYGTQWARAIPIGIVVVLCVTSVIFFRRRSRRFAEEA